MHTDALGSVVAVTDENRNIVERREYEPYGEQLTPTVQDGPGYTGQVMDVATGLTYMQQRYYDPELGRFLSVDPVTANANTGANFNRYWYANNNPYRFTDPDGRNATAALGGLIVESVNFLQGEGFNGAQVLGALKDGYNGEGAGFGGALMQDLGTASVLAGGAGALRQARKLAVKGGKEIVSRLAKGAVKDDVKGGVRQIVKTGGEKQMGRDMAQASRGATRTGSVETRKGVVRTAEHSDGTTVSARNFSSDGRPTVQVNAPKIDEVIKVRYDP